MRSLKKNLALGLLLTSAIMAVGCGKKEPTAEELLSQKFDESYIDADMELDLTLKMDMGSLMGGEGESDASAMMEMGMKMDSNIKSDGKCIAMDGKTTSNTFGMEIETPFSLYMLIDGSSITNYTLSEDGEIWTKNVASLEDSELKSMMDMPIGVNVEALESYELKKSEKSDKTYVVTGVISFEKLMEDLADDISAESDSMSISLDAFEESGINKMKMNATFEYDKETLKPVSTMVELDPESVEVDGVSIEKLMVKLTYNEFGTKKTVEIPNEVIDSAVESVDVSYSDEEFDFEVNVDDPIFDEEIMEDSLDE